MNSVLVTMAPAIDAFTSMYWPARSAASAMISSVRFPSVALSSPPTASPVFAATDSVAWESSAASGTIARTDRGTAACGPPAGATRRRTPRGRTPAARAAGCDGSRSPARSSATLLLSPTRRQPPRTATIVRVATEPHVQSCVPCSVADASAGVGRRGDDISSRRDGVPQLRWRRRRRVARAWSIDNLGCRHAPVSGGPAPSTDGTDPSRSSPMIAGPPQANRMIRDAPVAPGRRR